MKKYFIILFLFISYGIQSQVLIALLLGDKLNTGNIEFGLDGGFNYSSISGMDTNDKLSEFNIGFYFDFKLKEKWYLNTGVLMKSTLGVNNLSTDDLEFLEATIYLDQNDNILKGDYSQKMNYFLIPALAKYKFNRKIYAEAGLQIGWMYKSWIQFDSNIDGNSARIKENNKDMIHWFDMGVAAGAGYRLLNGYGWTLGVRYYYGLLDVYKDNSGTKNSSLFLKLNIPIGVTDEMKEKAEEQKVMIKEKKVKRKEDKKNKRSK